MVVTSSGQQDQTEVLAVDDTPANLLAIEAVLEPLGVPVVQLASGAAALEYIARHRDRLAVILLDVNMPGLDGFETARLVRDGEKADRVPIIFVTAVHREEGHIVRGYAHGAVDYIVKPFNPDVMRSKVGFFVAAHRRAELERRERQASERRLALALEAGNLGVWDWSAATGAVDCDERCRIMVGAGENEPLSLSAMGLTNPAAIADGALLRGEVLARSGRWVRTQSRVYGEGPEARIIGIVEDISDEKRAERDRELFIGMLGHDLRGPLSVVGMQATLFAEHPDPAIVVASQRVSRSVGRMAVLVANMLDLAMTRRGNLALKLEDASLDEICSVVVNEVGAAHPRHRIAFEPGNPRGGVWDPGRLTQVVHNLVTNAVRHADPETVVRLAVREVGEDVELRVANIGPPISDDLREQLFEPFVSTSGGPGLGLYIVKRLVEAHGGSVGVACDGYLTTFRIVLPRRSAADPDARGDGRAL